MLTRLRRLLPSREAINQHRWLRWLGPRLQNPRLWHMSRKGIALGLALGVFFGLLIPIAQIPASATLAVLLRANVPVAVASTLVTNPVTFGPVYYAAYKVGQQLLQEEAPNTEELQTLLERNQAPAAETAQQGWWQQLKSIPEQLGRIGKPLMLGLALFATVFGLLAYAVVHLLWIGKVRWQRHRRTQQATRHMRPGTDKA